MNPGTRKLLIPFLIVDFLFFLALALWWFHPRLLPHAGKAVLRVQTRHLENSLTEIDLVNDGNAEGPMNVPVDVTWPDADLVDAKGLGPYDQTSTGRRSEQFFLPAGHTAATLSPGATAAIGWLKLTADVPVHADTSGGAAPPM